MDMTIQRIEMVTGEALRKLPLGDEDIYSVERLEDMEEDDLITPEECGFMLGYLSED